MKIRLDDIASNPNQIRTIRHDQELIELAASVSEHGLLQPIKVRPTDSGFELVYGHRRFAAMQLLGWTECEAIVNGVSNDESLVQSIAENLQRQDLDVLDEARSYRILRERGFTIKEIAELVNKPHGRISNRLSILRLPEEVQQLVQSRNTQHSTTTEMGALSADSASRIASAIETPEEAVLLAEKAIGENLNSQEIRALTNTLKSEKGSEYRQMILEQPWLSLVSDGAVTYRTPSEAQKRPDSIGALFHRKVLWNLHRVDLSKFDHFTVGYSERTPQQLLELLSMSQVSLLADVRCNPISRFRPEFSKSNLEQTMVRSGIRYLHIPELGIPSEIRRTMNKESLFDWYNSNIQLDSVLQQYSELLGKERFAFICVELDPNSCHRHSISLFLERQGCKLLDL